MSGGGGVGATDGNQAFGHYSSILGGKRNIAGAPGFADHAVGTDASVSGGDLNTASGNDASISRGNQRSMNGGFDWGTGGLFQEY